VQITYPVHSFTDLFILFIYDLFKDAVRRSDYITSNYIMINELERMWKEVVIALMSRYYSAIRLERLKKTTKSSVRI
jgi:hypothetical protein